MIEIFYHKDGEEYNKVIKECHQRSADKLVKVGNKKSNCFFKTF
jgi:hypothetical protein